MNGRLKKNIGFTLMPIAFVFLFDPGYILMDALPDFVGYLILCLSLINLSDINPKIMEAFCKFRRAAVLSVLRFASLAVLELFLDGQEKTVTSLLFVFVFAIADMVTLLTGYKKLFEGLLYLGTYHDGAAVYECKKEGKPNVTESMYTLTAAFVIVKNVLWMLPEFTTLMADDTYEFVNVLRLFAAAIIVPLAVIWLLKMLIYINKVKNDQAFIDNLKAFYLEKTQDSQDFFTSRTISLGLTALTVAFVLSFDLFFDNMNIISDVWMYLCAVLGAVFLRRFSPKWRLITVTAIFGVAVSALCDLATTYFFSRYIPEDIIKDIGAYNAYYFMMIAYIAEAVVFCAMLVTGMALMYGIFSKHTDMSLSDGSAEHKEMKRRYRLGSVIVMLLGVISAFAGIYYVYSLPLYDKGEIFELSGLISRAACLVFVFAAWYFIGYVKAAVKQHNRSSLY